MKALLARIRNKMKSRKKPRAMIGTPVRGPVLETIEEARITLRNRGDVKSRHLAMRLHVYKQAINATNRRILELQREYEKHRGVDSATAGAFRASHAIAISQERARKIRLAADAQRLMKKAGL